MNKKMNLKKNGFTLLEGIIAIALISVITIGCMGVISSAASLKFRSDDMLEDQIAIKQTLLAVTREIRMDAEAFKNGYTYLPGGGSIVLGNEMVIQHIESCVVGPEVDGKVKIIVITTQGEQGEAYINLRLGTYSY
jgi:prepilin-type N-terminal cleavage/methylation domain-containing protein